MASISAVQRNTDDNSSDYEKLIAAKYHVTNRRIGSGGFGSVYLATALSSRKPVAAKMMLKKASKKSYFLEASDDYIREKHVLEVLQGHANIVRLLEAVETKKYTYIFLEYAWGGDLHKYVQKHHPLSEDICKSIFWQMLCAVQHMHANNIVHCDIKLPNVLVINDGANPRIALADFGLACTIAPKGPRLTKCCGTRGYMAPEILLRTGLKNDVLNQITGYSNECQEAIKTFAFVQDGYSKEADVWSLGIALFYLLTKQLPYNNGSHIAYITDVFSDKLDLANVNRPDLSQDAKHLLQGLLTIDSTKRCTIDEALNSEWFKEASCSEDSAQDVAAGTVATPTASTSTIPTIALTTYSQSAVVSTSSHPVAASSSDKLAANVSAAVSATFNVALLIPKGVKRLRSFESFEEKKKTKRAQKITSL
ncbi:kinase-like domain-containing protein [Syncephalis fuscata]|nr:kinase-like domain-containing protein [Syncephalis fuscata]KAI9593749.1 kinase-like domain-containing protein [Syncephalis fuscata]